MKKVIFILVPILISIALLFLSYQFFFVKEFGKGALQVTATPPSKVYLDGKYLGQTPICKCDSQDMIGSGEYSIRLVPSNGKFVEFQTKITITKSVLTVIDRKFAEGGSSEGSIISLFPLQDKKATQLLVLSLPDKAEVLLDDIVVGMTPVLLKNTTVSDHKLRLKKSGYTDKTVNIRTPEGYKLSAIAYLGVDTKGVKDVPTVPQQTTPTVTPTPQVTKILILQTPTGYLRVRADASLGSSEVGRVIPGESYELVSEVTGWYEIKVDADTTGWISSQYAQKQE